MTIEIRNVRTDEYADYVRAIGTGFLDRPDADRVAEQVSTLWEPGRTWAAFDGDLICGTFRSWATELTVPGGQTLPASAVAAVTVLPTHRRRGILTRLAAAEHAAIRDRGEAVGLLYASEYPIYGRFGYGPGCRIATWTLQVGRTGFHGRSRVVHRAHGARRGRRRDDPIDLRSVATPAAGRDPAPRLPLGRRPRAPGQPVGSRRGRGSSRSIETPPAGPTAMPATGARSSPSIASPRARSPSTRCTH